MRHRKQNQILLSLGIVFILWALPFAMAISGSDTAPYAYDFEAYGGIWGEKTANADKNTGVVECYVYITLASCEAWGGIFGYQSQTGSYRWRVEADVTLVAYGIGWSPFGTADIKIYLQLRDASYGLVAQYMVWSDTVSPGNTKDFSFSEQEMSHSFSTYFSTVQYLGLVLYTSACNNGKICQDASHPSDPAYIEISEIRWETY